MRCNSSASHLQRRAVSKAFPQPLGYEFGLSSSFEKGLVQVKQYLLAKHLISQ